MSNDVSDEEGLRLITAFLQITDSNVRKAIVEAAEAAQQAYPLVAEAQASRPNQITQDN